MTDILYKIRLSQVCHLFFPQMTTDGNLDAFSFIPSFPARTFLGPKLRKIWGPHALLDSQERRFPGVFTFRRSSPEKKVSFDPFIRARTFHAMR